MSKNKYILSFFMLIIVPSKIFAANYTCTVTTNNAAFGNFNPLNYANSDISISFTVRCPLNPGVSSTFESASISFSRGNSGTFSRVMKNGTNSLSYNLYSTNGYSQVLGDGTNNTTVITASGTVTTADNPQMTFTIYGRIPSQPTVIKGSYTDNIVITVTYN